MAKQKTKPTRKPRAPRPKQQYLDPDLAPPSIPEINAAAEAYTEVRDRRQALTTEEITRKDTLHRLMNEHKLESYEYDGKQVLVVKSEETVKVKRKKSTESNGDDSDE